MYEYEKMVYAILCKLYKRWFYNITVSVAIPLFCNLILRQTESACTTDKMHIQIRCN